MSGPEQRTAEGLLHLQGAAVQLIAATRAFLDVAEELVKDPGAAADVVATLSALAGAVRGSAAPHPPSPASPAGDSHDTGSTPGSRIRRIPVSPIEAQGEGSTPGP